MYIGCMVTPPSTYGRPRERLLRLGTGELSLAELIAVIIGSGTRHHAVNELAKEVETVLVTGVDKPAELMKIHGMGAGKASAICAALSLFEKVRQARKETRITSPKEAYLACHDLSGKTQEHIAVLFLGPRQHILERHIIAIGTADTSLIHPRDVFRPAIQANAIGIVLVHNHPSGDPAPSEADLLATRRIASVGREVGITLYDHVVVAANDYLSVKQAHPALFS